VRGVVEVACGVDDAAKVDVLADVAPRGDVHCQQAQLGRAIKDGPNGAERSEPCSGVPDGSEQRSYPGDRQPGASGQRGCTPREQAPRANRMRPPAWCA